VSEFHALDLGRVVAGFGRHYLIETPEGRRLTCTPRGKKSDCVVGDHVRWLPTNSQLDEGVIEHIEPRRNLLFRQDALKTKAFAANLDQVLVMVASLPVFSESQLARALIAAEHAHITAHIVLNKTDLPEIAAARERLAPYVAMGYHVLQVGLKTDPQAALALLEARISGQASLVLGPSGVGKSTLINLMAPQARAAVGEISKALQAGRHTTTHTQWHWLDAQRQTALLDSPGFQEFGLRHRTLRSASSTTARTNMNPPAGCAPPWNVARSPPHATGFTASCGGRWQPHAGRLGCCVQWFASPWRPTTNFRTDPRIFDSCQPCRPCQPCQRGSV
jgi:ribosome biogenesis GTPase / thiamine phosphate phosphatase